MDEQYFNIVKGEWSLSASGTMSDNYDMITDNIEEMPGNHDEMTDNHNKMTGNPKKLTIISPQPGLTFSYHRVLLPKTVAEQVVGRDKYVVGLRIRKLQVDSENLM